MGSHVSSVTLVHPAKAMGRNEMSSGRGICVVLSNIVLDRSPHGQGRFGSQTPHFTAMLPIAKLRWPLFMNLFHKSILPRWCYPKSSLGHPACTRSVCLHHRTMLDPVSNVFAFHMSEHFSLTLHWKLFGPGRRVQKATLVVVLVVVVVSSPGSKNP